MRSLEKVSSRYFGYALGDQTTLQRPYPGLAVLLLIYMCNTMDRNVTAFLAEPIRRDLQLSDMQLGLLTGLPFAFSTRCSASLWVGLRIASIGS